MGSSHFKTSDTKVFIVSEIMGNKNSSSRPRKHCLSLLSCSPLSGLTGMIAEWSSNLHLPPWALQERTLTSLRLAKRQQLIQKSSVAVYRDRFSSLMLHRYCKCCIVRKKKKKTPLLAAVVLNPSFKIPQRISILLQTSLPFPSSKLHFQQFPKGLPGMALVLFLSVWLQIS